MDGVNGRLQDRKDWRREWAVDESVGERCLLVGREIGDSAISSIQPSGSGGHETTYSTLSKE